MAKQPDVVRPNPQGTFPVIKRGVVVPVALGNGTQYAVVVIDDDGWGNMFVAVQGYGAYIFCTIAHPGYIGPKLGIKNKADAANFADFLNDQMGLKQDRKGDYMDICCSKK